ncbi:hypothetical protein DFP72DRAFT_1031801 [Ephemerocybe angulata]|uniref:Uncharacterized protein n=1 Tax=Ephemerocybe angulata TaxID=980116 RepID=A0A8H6I6J4_9AGAR|nr:hypothetical protein DFP72DRAFT_1031801 [Tulosesus angulatus]
MATAVERPFSSFGNTPRSHSTHSNPQEVIDVDLFDDDEVQVVGGSRRSSRPIAGAPETISLLDSDDEIEMIGSPRPVERRRLFSPPPRHNAPVTIPPFAGQTSMVHRSGHRHGPPPPVQAIDRTFNFNFGRNTPPAAGPSRRQPQAVPAPHAAPRSHHVPVLGLGGAIISNNRARVAAEQRGGFAHGRGGGSSILEPFFTGVPQAIRRIYPGMASRIGALLGGPDVEQDGLSSDEEEEEYMDFIRSRRDRFRKPLAEKEHYKTVYTHPVPAEPGFTFDFAPGDDSEETSNSSKFPPTSSSEPIVIMDDDEKGAAKKEEDAKMSTLLVCARCQDPLVLNSGLTGSDTYNRKIWALRCGHMVDGKCLGEIGQPQDAVDRKGKGKAKEEIPYGEDPSLYASRSGSSSQSQEDDPSIRSRLRSRKSSTAQESGSASPEDPPLASPSRKRKRATGKAASNKKAKVEADFEWKCPVPSCGRIHASVKISGGWGPEKERQLLKKVLTDLQDPSPRGAIQVFA